MKAQIQKISGEISGYSHQSDVVVNSINGEEDDLSLRKLDEYHAHLQALQKEKSDRLHKVLEYINEVHHFKSLVARLPPRAHLVYYRDEIGNISTSHLTALAMIPDFKELS